ncbi:MAG: putative toxin-antitoxin system toxin component, PIN family [Actinomycetota bacterium]|nr:putative toxin-antitoxin system toxin component, PIN family [Actinomycetota bacterium]
MIAVFADTNTLVSGLGWSGPPAQILDAVLAGQLVLVSSPALLAKLERVLAYPKLARVLPDPEGLVARLRTVVDLVEPTFELAVVADEPDNRVLEAAVAARADAIVTGDGGLLALGDHDGIPALSAAAFIEWWSSGTLIAPPPRRPRIGEGRQTPVSCAIRARSVREVAANRGGQRSPTVTQ